MNSKMDDNNLNEFLLNYPGMSIKPSKTNELILMGEFDFIARIIDGITIEDCYQLKIIIPSIFPLELPRIIEIGNKIPRDGKHHINPDDSLCLGSPIRLIEKISKEETLSGYINECLIPYLYAVSIKIRFGDDFIFGELAHGTEGIVDDYLDIFNLQTGEQLVKTIKLIKMKKRHANKQKCPCGCGKLLGKCKFNLKIIKYRKIIPRRWLK